MCACVWMVRGLCVFVNFFFVSVLFSKVLKRFEEIWCFLISFQTKLKCRVLFVYVQMFVQIQFLKIQTCKIMRQWQAFSIHHFWCCFFLLLVEMMNASLTWCHFHLTKILFREIPSVTMNWKTHTKKKILFFSTPWHFGAHS